MTRAKNRYAPLLALVLLALGMARTAPVPPLPSPTAAVPQPCLPLDGPWRFSLAPPTEYPRPDLDDSGWATLQVPGEPAMQGFAVEHDREMAYRRRVTVPAEWAGQQVRLRFESVYSYARVWVNGEFIADHHGGFTSFDCDLTGHVQPGQEAVIAVGVTDRADDPSFGSGYAKHCLGGLRRGVSLVCLPPKPLLGLWTTTRLTDNFHQAVVEVHAETARGATDTLEVSLTDEVGRVVSGTMYLYDGAGPLALTVAEPLLWDAEHPRLYRLQARLRRDGQVAEVVDRTLGLRELRVYGNRLLVNGREVKLRGACRHDVHPLLGRTTTDALDEQDVLLAKEANLNFLRTSHYPPSTAFLDACDRYGLYVEEESAACFVDFPGQGPTYMARNHSESDPAFRARYLGQLREMVGRDRDHPSVLLWSIANESKYGDNFQACYDWLKQADPSRPVLFSFPRPAGDRRCFDVLSIHYPGGRGQLGANAWQPACASFGSPERPRLNDEWAHVACYIGDTLRRDPNARNAWGEALKAMWEQAWRAPGSLGGAIWGYLDETFALPGGPVGYGEWGLLDVWRRPKPEHWLTKKAYSPIRLADEPFTPPAAGQPLRLPVANWFDHTDFSELAIGWSAGGDAGRLTVALAPHAAGELVVPPRVWAPDERLRLEFRVSQGGVSWLVDVFELPARVPPLPEYELNGPAPTFEDQPEALVVRAGELRYVFDKHTGLLASASRGGQVLLTGGPLLNAAPRTLPTYRPTRLKASRWADHVRVELAGHYGPLKVEYLLRIDGQGALAATWQLVDAPGSLADVMELGLAWRLPATVDTLRWDRQALWSVYPDDHLGRPRGVARRDSRLGPQPVWRGEPQGAWSEDQRDLFYRGRQAVGPTRDFLAAKEYVRRASAFNMASGAGVELVSDGRSQAVRLEPLVTLPPAFVDDRDPRLVYRGQWSDYADSADWLGTEHYTRTPGDSVTLAFSGPAVELYGPLGPTYGRIAVSLDGQSATEVDTYAPGKQGRVRLFHAHGLGAGAHRLKVECTGRRNPAATDCYLVVDGFALNGGDTSPELLLIVNREWRYGLGWGLPERPFKVAAGASDTVRLRLR